MNIENLKAKKEQSFNNYKYNHKYNHKMNKWSAWRTLLDQEETKQVYKDLFGIDYTFQRRNRLHLFKGWVIPPHIDNEDIALKWVEHDVLRHVSGCQIAMFDNWETKLKKSQVKRIDKLIKETENYV